MFASMHSAFLMLVEFISALSYSRADAFFSGFVKGQTFSTCLQHNCLFQAYGTKPVSQPGLDMQVHL